MCVRRWLPGDVIRPWPGFINCLQRSPRAKRCRRRRRELTGKLVLRIMTGLYGEKREIRSVYSALARRGGCACMRAQTCNVHWLSCWQWEWSRLWCWESISTNAPPATLCKPLTLARALGIMHYIYLCTLFFIKLLTFCTLFTQQIWAPQKLINLPKMSS